MRWIALIIVLGAAVLSGCATTGEVVGYADHSVTTGPHAGVRVAAKW